MNKLFVEEFQISPFFYSEITQCLQYSNIIIFIDTEK